MTLVEKLVITKKHIEDLVEYASRHTPFEACSLLLGVAKDQLSMVKETYHMKNTDKSINSFKMAEPDLIAAYQYSLEKKLNVIGIYHSHTHGIRPSMEDLVYMEINPVIWLIYSVLDCKFGAYVLETSLRNILIDIVKE